MSMEMTYEYVSPQMAAELLAHNGNNRSISKGTVYAYTQDILTGNWDEGTGASISIDENGVLRDGQHRLTAIIKANKGIHTWICRNVAEKGIYDNNRKRNNKDQISILRPDFESVYKSHRYISVAMAIIMRTGESNQGKRPVTPSEVMAFTEAHKEELDGFFLVIPLRNVPKISISVVHLALYMAYADGVDLDDILDFYEVLLTGMSTKPEEFPIIAYRNYLKDADAVRITHEEIARCQWALKKYLTGSCVKRTQAPKDLIYPFPYKK